MSYENAPATKMLATHCALCSRPLVDAESVETGVGPECRKRHGFGMLDKLEPAARKRANELIHMCATPDVSMADFENAVTELALMDCTKLAKRIAKRAGAFTLEFAGDRVRVSLPFSTAFLEERRAASIQSHWHAEQRVTEFSVYDGVELLALMRRVFRTGALVRVVNDESLFALSSTAIDGMMNDRVAALPARAPQTAAKRACAELWTEPGTRRVHARTPYHPEFVTAVKALHGRKYEGAGVWSVPSGAQRLLETLVAKHFGTV